MNNFSWSKALGFGVLVWLVMFVLGSITAGLGLLTNIWALLILAIIAGFVSYGFAVNAETSSSGEALTYGLTFVVVGLVLDYLITRQLQPAVFGLWSYWLGYALILFAPFTAVGRYHPTTHYPV